MSQQKGEEGRDFPALSQCLSKKVRVGRDLPAVMQCLRNVLKEGRDAPAALQGLRDLLKKEEIYLQCCSFSANMTWCRGRYAPAAPQSSSKRKRERKKHMHLRCCSISAERVKGPALYMCCVKLRPAMRGAGLEALFSRVCSGLLQIFWGRATLRILTENGAGGVVTVQ